MALCRLNSFSEQSLGSFSPSGRKNTPPLLISFPNSISLPHIGHFIAITSSNSILSIASLDSVDTSLCKHICPQRYAPDLDSSDEGGGILCVPSSNSAPALEVQKGVFNQVPQAIKVCVVFSLDTPVPLGGNDKLHVLLKSFCDNRVAVITLIPQQPPGKDSVNQSAALCAISNGTRCNKYSDRHTIRIHGQMYLCVEPPFVRAISWFPPTAPAA